MDNALMKKLKQVDGRNKTHCDFCGDEFQKFKQGHAVKIFLFKQWACGSCYSKAIKEQMENEFATKEIAKEIPPCFCDRCKEHEKSKSEMNDFINHALKGVI
tara:strand:- start:48834 stop:49139 length:306 start_codon:yes stop_codon:yes gene_type:complete